MAQYNGREWVEVSTNSKDVKVQFEEVPEVAAVMAKYDPDTSSLLVRHLPEEVTNIHLRREQARNHRGGKITLKCTDQRQGSNTAVFTITPISHSTHQNSDDHEDDGPRKRTRPSKGKKDLEVLHDQPQRKQAAIIYSSSDSSSESSEGRGNWEIDLRGPVDLGPAPDSEVDDWDMPEPVKKETDGKESDQIIDETDAPI